ncbi:MAG TPA: pyridoxamine 5'-phosphate oxidase family protein [Casimicrobiaceae bacterium]|nr:pyridoxamine 5'-phosphate oxidase family protein [Casimicrobiaceae bacterium]
MTNARTQLAREAAKLLLQQRIAALGTLHASAPSVTMTPFALSYEPFALIVLVSALASHTRDMAADARVGVMVSRPEPADGSVHSLVRMSVRARARGLNSDDAQHASARAAYERRFPDMRGLFELADFRLFLLEPHEIRVVARFAAAGSVKPESVLEAVDHYRTSP